LNTRDLEYLVAVHKHQHFGKAAESSNVSQPTLSNHIKKFEQRYGVKVFERNNKRVLTTSAGELIIEA